MPTFFSRPCRAAQSRRPLSLSRLARLRGWRLWLIGSAAILAALMARADWEQSALMDKLELSLSEQYDACAASRLALPGAGPAAALACKTAWIDSVQEGDLPDELKARLIAKAEAKSAQRIALAELDGCLAASTEASLASCASAWRDRSRLASLALSASEARDTLAQGELRLLDHAAQNRLIACSNDSAQDAAAPCVARWIASLSPEQAPRLAELSERALRRIRREAQALAATERALNEKNASSGRVNQARDPAREPHAARPRSAPPAAQPVRPTPFPPSLEPFAQMRRAI